MVNTICLVEKKLDKIKSVLFLKMNLSFENENIRCKCDYDIKSHLKLPRRSITRIGITKGTEQCGSEKNVDCTHDLEDQRS